MTIRESLIGEITRLMSPPSDAAHSAAAELCTLKIQRREEYLRIARRAASHERDGHYSTAADAWETARGLAQGRDVNWCKCRRVLCLWYAQVPVRQGLGAFFRERRTARAGREYHMTAATRYVEGDTLPAGVPLDTTRDVPPVTARPLLWLQVALWVREQGRPVDREAIARRFTLSERQAADVMLYITRRCGDQVASRRAVARLNGGIRRATLEVLHVNVGALPPRGYRSHARHQKAHLPLSRLGTQGCEEEYT
ncbi:ANR family transcriptional regulator [Serratia marcescens]